MKTTLVRSTTLLALVALISVTGFAESAARAQIIKERDAVLAEIVA